MKKPLSEMPNKWNKSHQIYTNDIESQIWFAFENLSGLQYLDSIIKKRINDDYVKNLTNSVVQNIVSTMDVENRIDVNNLSLLLPKIIYEPDQFPGAIFRTSQGPVCLIFSTGKVVIVGSKSEKQTFDCANNVANILKKFWLT
jgi:TATA-box binding protein (TBP) (component of TFIID and TFIIIB)